MEVTLVTKLNFYVQNFHLTKTIYKDESMIINLTKNKNILQKCK